VARPRPPPCADPGTPPPPRPTRRRNRPLPLSGGALPEDWRHAHQLPPPPHQPAAPGLRLCRPRPHDGRLPSRRRIRLPLLLLRRLHADPVTGGPLVAKVFCCSAYAVPVLNGITVADGGSINCNTRSSSFSCNGLPHTNRPSPSKSAESSQSYPS